MNDNQDVPKNTNPILDRPFHHVETATQIIHHFYICKAVGEPHDYVEMIHKIRMAGPNDIIYLHLNTPGGRLDTGAQILSAIQSCQGHIVSSVEGEVCSLGTLLFLAADEFIVYDSALLMFHNFSGGTYGKGNEQAAQIEATIKWFNNIARKVYIPFMSESEFDKIVNGQDMWLQADDIRTRLEAMVVILEKESKEKEPKAKPKKTLTVKPKAKPKTKPKTTPKNKK